MDTSHTTPGYTLIEMLVVIAIISIVFPVVMVTIVQLYKVHSDTLARSAALIEATKATKQIVRDVRAAMLSETGAPPIIDTATSSATFYADTDLDGTVERVRYFLDGTTLRIGVVEPTSTSSYPTNTETIEGFAEGIVNHDRGVDLFTYYDATSTVLAPGTRLADVRRVEVEVVAESSLGRQLWDVTVRSSASIRNLKDSY
jgi:prepilin-type N-terminal cleavage/methylation domain-containing protein